jgi:hypothetical protein
VRKFTGYLVFATTNLDFANPQIQLSAIRRPQEHILVGGSHPPPRLRRDSPQLGELRSPEGIHQEEKTKNEKGNGAWRFHKHGWEDG